MNDMINIPVPHYKDVFNLYGDIHENDVYEKLSTQKT